MQLSADVMNLIREDSTVVLLLSLTCRTHDSLSPCDADTVAKYCDITTIEKLDVGGLYQRAIKFDRLDLLQLYRRIRPLLIKRCTKYEGFYAEFEYHWGDGISNMCVRKGRLTLLKWCKENECGWKVRNLWTCSQAVRSGSLEMVKYCRENGCPFDALTCATAAVNGYLDILQWLVHNGCPRSGEACVSAVAGGHLDALIWLRANGCPWDERVCRVASTEGYLEILQWARANGCNWNIQRCLEDARDNNQHHVVEWINSHR
jgi:hypothetical protein